MYKMFIDDERLPVRPRDWKIVRSMFEFTQIVRIHGMPHYISFDHDLADQFTGYDIAKLIVNLDLDDSQYRIPDGFDFYVHSENPIGKKNIEGLLNNYLQFREEKLTL